MCDKCTGLFKDYSKLMDITLNMILKLKTNKKEKYHYEKIIKILLTGKWSASKDEEFIERLFKEYTPEEIAILIFDKCVIKKIKPEEILNSLKQQGVLNEAS